MYYKNVFPPKRIGNDSKHRNNGKGTSYDIVTSYTNNTMNDNCFRCNVKTMAGSISGFALQNVPCVNVVNDVYVPQRKCITISKLKVFIICTISIMILLSILLLIILA